jgi:hypothetical protein
MPRLRLVQIDARWVQIGKLVRFQRGPATVTGDGSCMSATGEYPGKAQDPVRAGSQETDPGRFHPVLRGKEGWDRASVRLQPYTTARTQLERWTT